MNKSAIYLVYSEENQFYRLAMKAHEDEGLLKYYEPTFIFEPEPKLRFHSGSIQYINKDDFIINAEGTGKLKFTIITIKSWGDAMKKLNIIGMPEFKTSEELYNWYDKKFFNLN